ncbi:MAG TPA: DUF1302 family protein [Nevskia sp.]|nr:DUF1302 family protein [Nevskia sp.]
MAQGSRAVPFLVRHRLILLAALLPGSPVHAGSMDLGAVHADYKLTVNYGVAIRMQKPDNSLINGPIDDFQINLGGVANGTGFTHTGLPTTVNADDADRNFKQYSLINNRVSGLLETQFSHDNYGVVLSGDGFYDQVYHHPNDADSPGTINKDAPYSRWSEGARYYDGQRVRLLDAYAYATWPLGEGLSLDVRAGQQLVAWGESLFFSGMAISQSAADATKAFTPGVEVKEILLPGKQVSASLAIGNAWTLMGYYKLGFKRTEIFPVGDYFSSTDTVGPGGAFAYGAVNPLALKTCPGLFGPGTDPCTIGLGLGGPVLNAPDDILIPRGADRKPSDFGQYGVGLKVQVTPGTSVGFHYLRYTDPNPSVDFTSGYPQIATVLGQPVTTLVLGEPTANSYFQTWYDGIHLYSGTFSTVVGPFNVAGEINYRQGLSIPVQSLQLGTVDPEFTRGELGQALASAIYAANPHLWFDNVSLVGEVGYVHAYHVDPVKTRPGIIAVGNGDSLFYDRNSWAFQTLAIPGRSNVFNGWDLSTPVSLGMIVKGNPSMLGAFGAFGGAGDLRLSLGASLQYLQNLQFSLSYSFFFGNPEQYVGQSFIKQNPFVDRDYLAFSVKYTL